MINRLNRYLAAIFLQRLLVTTFAMVVMLGVLDALGNADLLPESAGLAGSLRYMLLRMPILFDRVLLFALLLALLLSYVALIRRGELVVMAATGLSVFGQIRAMLPAVLLASLLSAVLIDQVNPVAQRALEDWLGPEALRGETQDPDVLWLADESWLVEVNGIERGRLIGLTLFERGENGRIAAVIEASAARPLIGGWALEGARQLRFDGRDDPAPAVWFTDQTPHTMRLLMAAPRDIALKDLWRLSQMTRSGSRPSAAYRVWFMARLALPLVAIGFLVFAVPLMQHFGRRDSGDLALAGGMLTGFAFMIADGVVKTLAESGTIGAVPAVLMPAGVLASVGLWLARRRAVLG